ncbi:3-methylaspartate ammonia-lyase [Pueribacillus theae]|uniref:3-methylaspartate ammonia-lyase n=1 Tax=Pueribacillus theae TaxID=2171751 RepID=A0A2U1JRH2_9BACI|nr:acyclic terpene utilization AtuA family protein [Pueribacillus theae]PWA07800.1 3-methylaspartate ammonia-lyase [Pueribacillus theae]
MEEIRILAPCGILGYGFSVDAFQNGLDKKPHLIAVDAGSTDGGPQKLGKGTGIVSKAAVHRDLTIILTEAKKLDIPVIIGSAGGAGCHSGVDWTVQIVEEICNEAKVKFNTAAIHADIEKAEVEKSLHDGTISPLGPVHELNHQLLNDTNKIVAQMGAEPIMEALKSNAQLIICGRAYDPAIFASFCIMNGFDKGISWHMGKILECGALCLKPGTAGDCAFGVLHKDFFEIHSLQEERKCNVTSVAAHVLYEKSHPYIHNGPGFKLDLSNCEYEQMNPYVVRVSGTRYYEIPYKLKLEGVRSVGWRQVVIAGIRDPIAIEKINEILDYSLKRAEDYFSILHGIDFHLHFITYGKNGVMGEREPKTNFNPIEIGLVIEVVAPSKDLSKAICSFVRSTILHYHYTGRMATSGNLAIPFPDLEGGEVFEFTIYHLMDVYDPSKLFKTHFQIIGEES